MLQEYMQECNRSASGQPYVFWCSSFCFSGVIRGYIEEGCDSNKWKLLG